MNAAFKKIISVLFSLSLFSLLVLSGCNEAHIVTSGDVSESLIALDTNEAGPSSNVHDIQDNGVLLIRFLDVGQGDAAFIELPNNKTMLIDAGTASAGPKLVSYIRSLGYSRIDYIVATHPHEDHIGGMRAVLSSFEIGEIWAPRAFSATRTYERFIDTATAIGLQIHTAESGKSIVSNDSLSIEILSPAPSANYDDLNNWSVVMTVIYKENIVLFTGDASKSVILSAYSSHVDLLKVAHHGSETSTDTALINSLTPSSAVISCGVGNQYGHPKDSVLKALSSTKVYRTDEQGTIVARCDGTQISFNVSPVAKT